MTIASEIQRLQNAKANIKQAIESKGIVVPIDSKIDTYDIYIDKISGNAEQSRISLNYNTASLITTYEERPNFSVGNTISFPNILRDSNLNINNFNTQVVKNLDGEIYRANDDVRDILAKHIVNPVRFAKSIQTMLLAGVATFIEIGPGKTLSGFIKRTSTDKELNILNINSVESLKECIQFLNK